MSLNKLQTFFHHLFTGLNNLRVLRIVSLHAKNLINGQIFRFLNSQNLAVYRVFLTYFSCKNYYFDSYLNVKYDLLNIYYLNDGSFVKIRSTFLDYVYPSKKQREKRSFDVFYNFL